MSNGIKTHTFLSALDAYPRRYTTPPSGRSPGFRQNSARTPCPLLTVTSKQHRLRDCLDPSYHFRYEILRILYYR